MKLNQFIAYTKKKVLAMRTSSHRLAAVRKREAMLLESVYSRSFCRNLASYLKEEKQQQQKNNRKQSGLRILLKQ